MAKKAKKAKWTVMLYMAASKDEQTEQAAIRETSGNWNAAALRIRRIFARPRSNQSPVAGLR